VWPEDGLFHDDVWPEDEVVFFTMACGPKMRWSFSRKI
jgi:hypothetical protein